MRHAPLLMARTGAYLLDCALVLPAVAVLFGLFPRAMGEVVELGVLLGGLEAGGYLLVWLCASLTYHTLFEGLLGATPGKWLLGLRVRDRYGRPPGLRAAAARELGRYAEVPTLAGPLLVAFTGMRLADLLCGTRVSRNTLPAPGGVRRPGWLGRRIGGLLDGGAGRRKREAQREAGAMGEQLVKSELEPLTAYGYHLYEHVAHRAFGDVDLLAVGPGGAFVVEVKAHRGHFALCPVTGQVVRDGAPLERDPFGQLGRQVEHFTGTVARYAGGHEGVEDAVVGMVCLPNARYIDPLLGARGAVSLAGLLPTVLSAPDRLTARQIKKLTRRIAKVYGARPFASAGYVAGQHTDRPLYAPHNPHYHPRKDGYRHAG